MLYHKKYFYYFWLLIFILNNYSIIAQSKRANKFYYPYGYFQSFQGDSLIIENQSRFSGCEATAAICDTNGNLLLYTNNETIWNSNHQIIVNGYNFRSCRFFTQGALFVPFSSNTNKYYIVYPDTRRDDPNITNCNPYVCLDLFPNNGRLWLSIIDLSTNNGTGAIIDKDREVYGNRSIVGVLAATKHANKKDTWLLTVDTLKKQVVALLLTDCGVIDTVYSNPYTLNALNQMNIHLSPDGNYFYMPFYFGDKNNSYSYTSLYSFNTTTGKINHLFNLNKYFYDFDCFSTDGKYLFSRPFINNHTLIRYDLSSNDSITIMQTEVNFGGNSKTELYYLPNGNLCQFAYDNGINNYIIINNLSSNPPLQTIKPISVPNLFFLSISNPNFISNYFDPTFKEYVYGQVQVNHNRVCVGGETFFKASKLPPATPYHWEIYEGNTLVKTIYNQDSITHTFSKAGDYVTKLWIDFSCIPDSVILRDVIVDSFPIDYIKDQYLCKGIFLNAQPNQVSYRWNDNSLTPYKYLELDKEYWVEVTNTCGTYKDDFSTTKIIYTGTNLATSNNDNKNDQLVIENNSPNNGSIKIYTIWGDCVFQAENYTNNWPSDKTNPGVYFYEYTIQNCTPFNSWIHVTK